MKKQILKYVMVLMMLALAMPLGHAKELTLKGKINVNSATAEQLQLLPGVGPSKAQRIVEARKQNPFSKPEDLLNVKGIGEALITKWAAYVVFEGATSLQEVDIDPSK